MIKFDGLFYEPIDILSHLTSEYGAEMEKEQQAFLCGLIKEYKPQKIVEIGVAAGGTTAVILNCISMLGLEAQLFSLDLSTFFYQDKTKKTGYLAEECKKLLDKNLDHTLYTGKYAVEYLEEIGKDIDFLILDTVHRMPGEILDFLAFFPYLKRDAVVVVHDIALNHYYNNWNAFATKLLFDVVAGRKLYRISEKNTLLNIGAFIVNEDTNKYISNTFSALTITWQYCPKKEELDLYRDCYLKYYQDVDIELFDMAVSMNCKSLEKKRIEKKHIWKKEFIDACQWSVSISHKRIYVYGCGYYGKRFYEFLTACGMRPFGYIISDGHDKKGIENVFYLSDINLDEENYIILIGVEPLRQEEIRTILIEHKIDKYMIPSREMYMSLNIY